MTLRPIRRALLSVSDKSGLVDFATGLAKCNIQLVSTGGTLGLAATIATPKVFDAFWSDDPAKALMHGPSYMANALACAAANASLDLFECENRCFQAAEIAKQMGPALGQCLGLPGVKDIRVRGGIGVVELDRIADLNALKRCFADEGVWVRPFRNIVYLTPALTIGEEDLEKLTSAIVKVLGCNPA